MKDNRDNWDNIKNRKKELSKLFKVVFKKNSCKFVKSVPKKKNDSKCPLKMSKSMVVSGFFRTFAEHLRKMHAQAHPPEACEASTNVAKGTDRTSYGGQPKASEVATARPTGCIANSHLA